jgi:hypothetical protein
MPQNSKASNERESATEIASPPLREVNEVLALTLAIIRTPFGRMMSAQSPLGGGAETDAA